MEIAPELKMRFEAMLQHRPETMASALGMTFLKVHKDEMVMSMPVDKRTIQPMGLLHGGASVALAETAASVGAWLNLEDPGDAALGIEINANHIKAVRSGTVVATARPVHRGQRIQVWSIEICDESGNLVCLSRCTLAVRRRD